MVAGGGASVIYADTVGDLGYAHELGNYAEYRWVAGQRHAALPDSSSAVCIPDGWPGCDLPLGPRLHGRSCRKLPC